MEEKSNLENKVKISMLCEIYGVLLTTKQYEFLNDYYNNDLSLSEIAENNKITRQAVRDIIKKGEKKLFEYEEKLAFMKRTLKQEKKISEVLSEITKIQKNYSDETIEKGVKHMAFEGLSNRLQEITRKIRGKARITESDLKEMLREVKLALLEADVNYKIVKEFISTIQEKALGQDVLKSLTPGQQVIKIVKDELTELLRRNRKQNKLHIKSTNSNHVSRITRIRKNHNMWKISKPIKKTRKKAIISSM